jgi:Ran GTPase-activating protein 1
VRSLCFLQADTTLTKNPSTHAFSALSKLSRYQIKREENRHNLTCHSEHPAGNQADSVILNVLYRPIVNVTRNRYSVMEGVELRIPCQVDSNPPATVTWRRLNSRQEVPTFSRTDPNIIYYDRVPRELDGAIFECIAQNEFGTSETATVQVDVLCKEFSSVLS